VVNIADEDIKKRLYLFGLTKYEAELYFLLMKYRILTAAKLGKLSNVPITRVYDTAKSLAEKGLIGTVSSKPKQYGVLPFEESFKALIARKKEDFEEGLKKLESERELILKEIPKATEIDLIDAKDFCFTMDGKKSIIRAWHSLFLAAKKEVFIFSGDSNWVNAESLRLTELIRKNVDVRILANTKYPENLKNAEKTRIGVRLSDNVLRGVIVDGKYVYLSKKYILQKNRELPWVPCDKNPAKKENEKDDVANCWEFWKCPEKIKKKCPAYVQKRGNQCWIVANLFAEDGCPKLNKKFKSCTECTWFSRMNSIIKDYSCIITEDKNIVESLREYFLMKWDSGKRLAK